MMAPLQRRAWMGLAIGLATAAAIAAILAIHGVASTYEDATMRVTVEVIFVAGLALYGAVVALTRRRPGREEVLLDERDEAVMRKAPVVQLWAVILSLVAWSIALTEVYWDRGSIPVFFPYLMLFSSFIVSILAQAVGILVGYRRMG